MNRVEQLAHMLRGNGVTDTVRHAYQRLFSTDDGKLVLEDLCKRYFIFDTLVKRGDDRDTILTNEGKRAVVLFILGLLNADLELYEHILKREIKE